LGCIAVIGGACGIVRKLNARIRDLVEIAFEPPYFLVDILANPICDFDIAA
jgi:hypothetical protein